MNRVLTTNIADATVHRSFACTYVICMAHDVHFLPFINVSGQRISWLIANCGSVVDEYVNPRRLRSSLVLNMVVGCGHRGQSAGQHVAQHSRRLDQCGGERDVK